ncbi:Holliday junction resolvase RuvX [Desulfonatronovibrio magnus]|uniref:Holliday junction resolvase RuvX n=1 Tax=Desulfonatronovibrio magnus TaxID=698827 RepID=UPI0005EB746A|nr:Holliday junction resolvase RuvX [Desulfonatronovibrio magnus]
MAQLCKRCLGIDFGIKRVGLAISPADSSMVFPLKTINRTTRQKLFQELLEVIVQQKIDAIVIGLPVLPDEQDSETLRQVRNFRESLVRRVDLPVFMVNEAFTSAEARAILQKMNMPAEKIRQCLDQAAAMLILESFRADSD